MAVRFGGELGDFTGMPVIEIPWLNRWDVFTFGRRFPKIATGDAQLMLVRLQVAADVHRQVAALAAWAGVTWP